MTLSVIFTIAFSMSGMLAQAQQKYKFSGKQTVAFSRQERTDVPGTEGHMLSLAEMNGVYENSGNTEFMDGVRVFVAVTSDLVGFSGPFQGYSKTTKKGESTITNVEGKTTTTLSADGTPGTTAEGTFHFIKGTGQFENIKGGGTIKGRNIASNIIIWDVEGEYWIEKQDPRFLKEIYVQCSWVLEIR